MGTPRFDPETGLPFGVRVEGPSDSEKRKVAMYRARLKGMQNVWERRKGIADEMRRMLAGRHFGGHAAAVVAGSNAAPVVAANRESETNLFLRAQRLLKAEAADEDWATRYPVMGDMPDEMVDEIEAFCDRLAVSAYAMREFSDALDDGGTVGPMVLSIGCDRVISRKKDQGAATPISELVNAAAGGADVHPMPGMDYLALSQSCRDFAADPEQSMVRSIEELDNLERLAQEADLAWAKEAEAHPSGYEYGNLVTRRLVYGDDVWWDSQVTTRWQDAKYVAIRKLFTPNECKKIEEWKPSARHKLKGTPLSQTDGWQGLSAPELGEVENSELNNYVSVIEFWDKELAEVHYFVENGEYQGFLERDCRYPYNDERGRPLLKDWFPIRACTPVVHNERTPDRTLGIPWLQPGMSAALRYNLFAQAEMTGRRKAGRIVEVPDDIDDDTMAQIESGADCVIIKRTAQAPDGKPLITIHDWGNTPVDFTQGKRDALFEFARDVDVSVEKISGQSIEPTVGQAQMAQMGSDTAKGGLIRKLQTFAGEIVADLCALARKWTDEKVSQMMGAEFTKRGPMIDPATGIPVLNDDGTPGMLPSIWDVFKGSSTLGDQIQVVFSPSHQDLLRQKAEDDTLALLASPAGMNPLTTLPYFDPRPLLERALKTRGMGRVQPFPVPPPPPPTEGGPESGGPPGEKKPGGEREAPGGGRTDGRAAHGMRGPPPVPGRQGRGEGPGDIGDQSVRAHRIARQ